ncbi:hypothetical protein psyc5s11_15620 [Clostridium gelidum]|uniref:Uncharacterized protein n=1 Tax=Clostridium gelidum TaxID=704125 RepID=A0ABM7T2M7_9CLOT|nr:hypothetical protein [Clostridium gelidum]BCZ45495.1 hypothetical protein psyc5s11_15620 [Clostridium gelidum]
MLENFIKVEYSIKNIMCIFSYISVCILIDVFFIFVEPISIGSIYSVIAVTFSIPFAIYFAFNRIREISLHDGKLLINRFLLGSLEFDGKDIKFISKDAVRIGEKSFRIKFVINKSELIVLLLNAMEIKNIDENINVILGGAHVFTNKEFKNQKHKQMNIIGNVRTILLGIICIMLIVGIIRSHCAIIFTICIVIFIGLYYLKYIVFEKRINNINSKFLRLILNWIANLVSIALTVALGIVIYTIFKSWDINLLKITV